MGRKKHPAPAQQPGKLNKDPSYWGVNTQVLCSYSETNYVWDRLMTPQSVRWGRYPIQSEILWWGGILSTTKIIQEKIWATLGRIVACSRRGKNSTQLRKTLNLSVSVVGATCFWGLGNLESVREWKKANRSLKKCTSKFNKSRICDQKLVF